MTKEIDLTQGKVALVDDKDYKELNKCKWYAVKLGNNFYAMMYGPKYMHRVMLGLQPGDKKITDHINRNGLDNQRSNLRIVSRTINRRNHGDYGHNTSGHNGVYWHKQCKKWRAHIYIDRKSIHLGYYSNIDDAVEARAKGELKYWAQ